jgi:hypothetical protein
LSAKPKELIEQRLVLRSFPNSLPDMGINVINKHCCITDVVLHSRPFVQLLVRRESGLGSEDIAKKVLE